MLRLIFITLFPSYFEEYFKISLAKKAVISRALEFKVYNIRDFSIRGKADDSPYGGGKGMIIKIEPLIKSLATARERYGELYIILLCPQGKIFEQNDVERLKSKKNITFVCGHYEGIDQRIEGYINEKISIGSYITMGGEIPSLVISESLIRAIPNFIKKESFEEESHTGLSFDYDSYTRPSNFYGKIVPEELISGNHRKIKEWKKSNSTKKELINNPWNEDKEVEKLPNPDTWRLKRKTK